MNIRRSTGIEAELSARLRVLDTALQQHYEASTDDADPEGVLEAISITGDLEVIRREASRRHSQGRAGRTARLIRRIIVACVAAITTGMPIGALAYAVHRTSPAQVPYMITGLFVPLVWAAGSIYVLRWHKAKREKRRKRELARSKTVVKDNPRKAQPS